MKKLDLRTRKGRRQEIIERVKEHKSISMFWILENPVRCSVACDMRDSGELVLTLREFPMYKAELK